MSTITAGTTGIGEAIAAGYVERDDEVVVTGRREGVGEDAGEEIEPLAASLAGDGASYAKGANIPVDGGLTAF